MNKKKVVILIPTHRPNLIETDMISLAHLKKHLGKYDICFVIPKKISGDTFKSIGYRIKKVNNNFFGTLRRVNESLLNKEFYENFKDYEYLLLYQLDAIILSNQLEMWLKSGYDFIAAPWFRPIIGHLTHQIGQGVSGGNGGFSLRNIQKSIEVLSKVEKLAKRNSKNHYTRRLWFWLAVLTGKSHKIWLNAPADNYPFNEDGFWSYEAPKYLNSFKVAPFSEALKFSFERYPKKCFELNGHKLPFGAHAWEKYDKDFWLGVLFDNNRNIRSHNSKKVAPVNHKRKKQKKM